MPIPPKLQHAINTQRTLFPKSIKDPFTYTGKLLKSSEHNSKLGKGKKVIEKGPLKGAPLFYLTLEERATCPPCDHYNDCYGNHTPFAHRFKHGLELESKLRVELSELMFIYHKALIRLHQLGDFYSLDYLKVWEDSLKSYGGLHVFGYTAHCKGVIYDKIMELHKRFNERWMFRVSTANINPVSSKNMYAVSESFSGKSVICPEQLDKTESCLTCGLCWNNNFIKPIKFLTH